MTTLEWCSLDFALSPTSNTTPGQPQQHLALLFCGDAAGNVPVFCLSVNQESTRASPSGSSGRSASFSDNSDASTVGSLHPIALIGLDVPTPIPPASSAAAATSIPSPSSDGDADADVLSNTAIDSTFDVVRDEVPARVQPFSCLSPLVQLHCVVEAHGPLSPPDSDSSAPLRSLHAELLLLVSSERAQHLVRLHVLLEEELPDAFADADAGARESTRPIETTQASGSGASAQSPIGASSEAEATATASPQPSNRMRVSVVSVVDQHTVGNLPRFR